MCGGRREKTVRAVGTVRPGRTVRTAGMIGIVEREVPGIVGTDGTVKNHQGYCIGSIFALAGTTNDCSVPSVLTVPTALTVLTVFTDLPY
jgi:hypothetical protein